MQSKMTLAATLPAKADQPPALPREVLAFKGHPRLQKSMAPHTHHTPRDAAAGTPANAPTGEKFRYEDLLVKVGTTQDRDAFVKIFDYYAPRVKSYLLKHGAADSAAEEIVQNTFITVWEKAKGYNPKKSAASTWIFTIARNKRIDALRREKFVEVNSDAPEIQNASYTAEDGYATAEDVSKLNTAIETLPPEQAELLRMAFFEEKSHSDISKETHIPLGTVKSRLRLAMDKLRGLLGAEGGSA